MIKSFVPQAYPLWAGYAESLNGDPPVFGIAMVIGWTSERDSSLLAPVIARPGACGARALPGSALVRVYPSQAEAEDALPTISERWDEIQDGARSARNRPGPVNPTSGPNPFAERNA